MDFHIPDYVRVTIEGNSVTPYIVSYTRKDDLCELGVSFSLQLSLTCPYTINPYDDVLIEELYDGSAGYVLRGYTVELNKNFEEGLLTIQGLDKSLLLNDYFIPQELISHGQTVNYWINYLVGLTGLSTHFDATSTYIVENETPLGFQTVADAILSLERQAAYYAKYDSQNDYVKIFRLGSSQTVLTIATDDVVDAKRSIGTENTRNVVKIYGGYKYNILDGSSTQVFAKARSNIPELLVDKTAVIVSPVLRSQTYAYIVANRILSVVNGLDDEQFYILAGFYPTVHVGEGVYIDVNFANLEFHGNRMITSIETSVSSDGAFTTIGVGKKCPRISINLPDPPVFVTDSVNGVGVSWDGGDSFVPSNIGLAGDALDAYNIAVNQWGQSMVLTKDGLYKRYGTGGYWSKLGTLPDPVNTAGDIPTPTISGVTVLKVVDEPTGYGKFHVLARQDVGILRSWIYTTKNFGISWDSEELWVNKTPSGIAWNVYPIDIEASPTNNIYTLVNRIPESHSIYFGRQTSLYSFDVGVWANTIEPTDKIHTVYRYTSSSYKTFKVYSIPSHRGVAFAVLIQRYLTSTKPWINIHRTDDYGETWTEIYSQQPTLNMPVGISSYPNYYWGVVSSTFYMNFDYESTSGNVRFTYYTPSIKLTTVGHNPPPHWEHTQQFYDGGYTFTIDGSGNVIEGVFGPTYSGESETWEDLNDGWNAIGYTCIISGPLNKYSYQAAARWDGPFATIIGANDEYPDGETYSSYPDPKYIYHACYNENPADDVGESGASFTYPGGMSGMDDYAYDDGLIYHFYKDSTDMYVGYGTVNLINVDIDTEILGPEPSFSLYYSSLDIEAREDN